MRAANLFQIICFFVILTSSPYAGAQEVIVEATNINEGKIEPSRSARIISESELRLQKATTVADVLRSIPGLEVVRQGGVGQTTSVFIRGARSEDTLVLIDGMEANDAMSPACGFDFSSMMTENIERIEIYRGPQSVRFGAGALGGVINIITKEGAAKSQFNYLAEAGSFQTDREALSSNGKTGDLAYSLGLERFSSRGFSAASERSGNTEPDGTSIGSISAKLVWNITRTAKAQATIRYTDANIEIDSHGGVGGDDPNNTTQAKQVITGLSASDRFFDEHLKSTFGLSYSEVDRTGRNEPNIGNTTDSRDHFLSENRKVHLENELTIGEYSTFRLGIQGRDESGLSNSILNGTPTSVDRKDQSVLGESLTYLFESESWFFDIGSRADHSSKVGAISSYRTSFGRKFLESEAKAYVSYGTGFKLPSLYQLYSTYGDQNLKQEDSDTIESTVEKKIGMNSLVIITAFENHYRNLIDYNMATSRYFNLSKARSRGFEFQASSTVKRALTLKGSYAYLETVDETTGLKLLRRPQNAWTAVGIYKIAAYEISGQYSFRGERDDIDPVSFQRISNGSYDLVNVGGSYQFKDWLKVYARIENVFDRKYEEVAGYGTAGQSIYAGLSGDF